MTCGVAVLVDGENIGSRHAAAIRHIAAGRGAADILRVYGDVAQLSGWQETPGFRVIHSGPGRNSADMLLCVDAMELAFSGRIGTILLVSSDADFTHVAWRLRDRGLRVVGVGEAKAPEGFRAACTAFETLDAPRETGDPACPVTSLDRQIRTVIAGNSTNGQGVPVAFLSQIMHQRHGVRIRSRPERTWRAYLMARQALYDLDPRSPEARVRFRPAGFGANVAS